VLLSRTAEGVYWAGRYAERAEATARLVKVHTELFLDLPRSAGVGWSPLLAVTGSGDAFSTRHSDGDEDEVVAFLVVDSDNPSSVIGSLASARANLRVTRTVLPRLSWEVLNELFLWAVDTSAQAVDRRTRLAWMDHVVRQCQLFSGSLAGTMYHDESYSFLEIGRFIDRADMTTRVLDVQAEILLGQTADTVKPYADITWMNVLQSLNTRQIFLKHGHAGASGPEALRFLLRDPRFPRSVEHCLTSVSRCLLELPAHHEPMSACALVQSQLEDADVVQLAQGGLHELTDGLQRGIGHLHDLVTATYFGTTPDRSANAVRHPVTNC
jgi:uncharacterized alpha-E superfamily protein